MVGKARRIWILVLGAVLLIGVAALVGLYFSRPTTLVVAVDPSTEEETLLSAVGEQLKREHASVRLQVRQLADPDAVRAALEKKQADLAVIRADRPIPIEARAVAVMRNDVLVLIARGGTRIQSVTDLAGKRIGMVGKDIDTAQLSAVLSQYKVPATWTTVTVEPDRVASVLGSGSVDAIAVAGPVTGNLISGVAAAFGEGNRGPVFIPIDQAEVLAQRLRVYEASEIPAGMFSGSPAKPAESVETIGFAHYLLAHADVSEQVIAELARRLISARRRLADEHPALTFISAPATAKDATVPPHPGAAAFFNDAERSFFDRYGDWVYILAMVASVLGSIAAALSNYVGSAGLRRRGLARELGNLMKRARAATSVDALVRIEADADKILARSMVLVEAGRVPPDALASFSLSFDMVRRAVAERRAALAERETQERKTSAG
jgi:TRAP transporter TAXI family solute receptor